MHEEKFYRMLGLAARGRNIASGEGSVSASIRDGSAKLVIVSTDASENTKKKFRNSCSFYSVPYAETGDRYILGKSTGKGFAVVLAVKNEDLAKRLQELLQDERSTL